MSAYLHDFSLTKYYIKGPDSKIFIRNDRYKSNKDLSINAPSYRSDDRYHESAADYQFDKDCSFLDGKHSPVKFIYD